MPDEEKVQRDLANQPKKTADAIQDVNAPQSEQAVTRDVTPSVEKPGHAPTRPDRPKP